MRSQTKSVKRDEVTSNHLRIRTIGVSFEKVGDQQFDSEISNDSHEDYINLNECMNYFYMTFRPAALKKGLEIRYDTTLADKDSGIITGKNILFRVIGIVLEKCIKHTDSGYISFGYMLKGGNLEFYISDTGKGINENKIREIYNESRIEERSRNGGACHHETLSDCIMLIARLNGQFRIISDEWDGSIFYFNIPYKKFPVD